MAFDPEPAERTGGRVRDKRGAQMAPGRRRPVSPARDAEPPAPDGPASIDGELGLLWGALQRHMLELLTHGIASPFQRRAFDRLEYSMKQYGKLCRERADELRSAKPGEPDADEIAAVLDKMDRRIDALAQERFKKLAQRELHDAGAAGIRAGMDV